MEFVIIGGAILIAWIIVWLIVGIIAGTVDSVQESMKKTGGAGFFGFLRFLSSLAIASATNPLSFLIGAGPKILGMGRSTAVSIAVFFRFCRLHLVFLFSSPTPRSRGTNDLADMGQTSLDAILGNFWCRIIHCNTKQRHSFSQIRVFFGIVGIINFISFPLSRDYEIEEAMPAGEDHGGYDPRTWQQQFVNVGLKPLPNMINSLR